jgi:hypothetical protein
MMHAGNPSLISSPHQLTIPQVFLADEMLYFTQLPMVKISICFFYLRSPPGNTIRYLIYGTIVFNSLTGIAFYPVAFLQCHPIKALIFLSRSLNPTCTSLTPSHHFLLPPNPIKELH